MDGYGHVAAIEHRRANGISDHFALGFTKAVRGGKLAEFIVHERQKFASSAAVALATTTSSSVAMTRTCTLARGVETIAALASFETVSR